MPRKLNYEEVEKLYERHGCVLLEEEYKNSKTKMRFKCKCGTVGLKSYNAFKDTPRCVECSVKYRTKNTPKRNKYNIEKVREIFKEKGYELLSQEYVNYTSKLEYVCSCGTKHSMTLSNILKDKKCPYCTTLRKRRRTTIKYTDVVKDFENKGFELLTDEKDYKNTQSLVEYRCVKGHVTKKKYTYFRATPTCPHCNGTAQPDFDIVKKEFEKHGCVLLEDSYVSAKTRMNYICDCGNVSVINWNNFKSGKRCNTCAREKRASKHRLDLKYLTKLFEDNGCELLSDHYINQNQDLEFICKCGRLMTTTYSTFKLSKKCKECSFSELRRDMSYQERVNNRKVRGYAGWRSSVYARDNYTCQSCGDNKSGNLNAHHLNSYHWYKEGRVDVNNGVSLCEHCHILSKNSFHSVYGRVRNTKEQYEEWIKNYQEKMINELNERRLNMSE